MKPHWHWLYIIDSFHRLLKHHPQPAVDMGKSRLAATSVDHAYQASASSTAQVFSPANASVRSLSKLSSLEISNTINLARILLIVGLVFLHYLRFPNSTLWPSIGLDVEQHSFATFVNSAVYFFFLSAVPLLSMISGYLFFSFGNNDPLKTIFARTRGRFTSLYLPLVFWNAVFMAGLYAVYKTNMHYPLLLELNINFNTAGWKDYINGIFGLTRRPIAFQFWFVRDLFVTAIISPIFLLMIRHAPWLSAAALGIAWISGWPMFIFLRPDVPFFFYLGTLVQVKRLPMTISRKAAIAVTGVFIAIVCLRALAPLVVDLSSHILPTWLRITTALMRFVGVVACWGILQHMAQTPNGILISKYSGLAFFLHSAHWPLLALLKLWLWPLMPAQTDVWMLVHDFACVSLTLIIGLGMGILLNRYAPAAFALMNGGRLLGQTKEKALPP